MSRLYTRVYIYLIQNIVNDAFEDNLKKKDDIFKILPTKLMCTEKNLEFEPDCCLHQN